AVRRNAFYVNGVGSDPRFSELLFRQGTDRLLAMPLFTRGRLVGFIDMRDKAGKKPFDTPDVEAAKKIADDVLALLGSKNLFGVVPITPAEQPQRVPPPSVAHLPQVMTPPAAQQQPQGVASPHDISPNATRAIASAREFMSKRQLMQVSGKRVLTERDLEVVRLLLPATLAIPGAVLACFSAIGHVNNPQSIVAIATVTDDAMEMLQTHLQAWLKRANQPHMTSKPLLIYPFGVQVVPVSAAGISTILSAPVNAQSVEGLVLTVAFERTERAQDQRALHIFLRQGENSVEAANAASSGRNDRQVIAEKLVEPDFQRYPELAEHCRAVSVIAQRFAIQLELPPTQVETIGLAEHPIVGAALVEPLLGADIAQAVLRHHERVDGRGYPSRLTGAQIPLS